MLPSHDYLMQVIKRFIYFASFKDAFTIGVYTINSFQPGAVP